jgi:hypothetical protein
MGCFGIYCPTSKLSGLKKACHLHMRYAILAKVIKNGMDEIK